MDSKKTQLTGMVKAFKGKKIAVVGDMMLDMYTWGKVSRISPEAPVPVVRTVKVDYRCGGAANVMRNIVSLGGEVKAFGVIGDDESGRLLLERLRANSIDHSGIISQPGFRTIRKQRVMAGAQQLLRIDDDPDTQVSEDSRAKIADLCGKALESGDIDALVIEDYAKGLFSGDFAQNLVDKAAELEILTALDPNPRNPMRLRNLTIMKPNRNEACELASIRQAVNAAPEQRKSELMRAAAVILNEWKVKYLLISLSEEGMALFSRGADDFVIIPTRAKEVFDVSGAGDTVIAAASLALTVSDTPVMASEIANYAAGIVVAKLGTAAVSADELIAGILSDGA